MCSGIPEERCKVILHWAPAATLEVYEAGFPVLYHHVPGLEVTVQESVSGVVHGIFTDTVEVVLEPYFIEVNPRELKEIVLEVVEVKTHHSVIQFPVREAYAPVKTLTHLKLNGGKEFHGPVEPPQFLLREGAFFYGRLQKGKELPVTKVFLEVGHLVIGHGINLGRVKPCGTELCIQGEERAVFRKVSALAANHGSGLTYNPVILTCAAGQRKEFRPGGFNTKMTVV